jgi:hypothetical protein
MPALVRTAWQNLTAASVCVQLLLIRLSRQALHRCKQRHRHANILGHIATTLNHIAFNHRDRHVLASTLIMTPGQ